MSEPADTFTANLVAFCSALREHGIGVSTDEALDAARTLTAIDPLDRGQFYHGMKATVLEDPTQEPVFDDLFEAYWDDLGDLAGAEGRSVHDDLTVDDDRTVFGDETDDGAERVEVDPPGSDPDGLRAPGDGVPPNGPDARDTDAGSGSGDDSDADLALEVGRQEHSTSPAVTVEDGVEPEELSILVADLGRQLGTLRGFRRSIHTSGEIDLRRSLDQVRTQNPADLPRVERMRTRAKVRFFVDVSHSMLRNMDQEFLLLFLFESMRQYPDVRIFLFDTSAAEVTRHFRAADVGRTLAEMRRTQTEWGAGTTIGSCLADVLATDPYVVDADTTAVIISDGWDAGETDRLRTQMAELDRRCRTVLWFNPRASASNYRPKVGGIQTALPFVDHFFAFSSVADLRDLVDHLRSRASLRPA